MLLQTLRVTCLQVYRGKLRSTGEEVALKVQRPGIGEQICVDMVLLRRLMMAVDSTLPRLNLPIQVRPRSCFTLPAHGLCFGLRWCCLGAP